MTTRKISEKFKKITDEFLDDPPDIIDYKTFNQFYNSLAKCVLRAEVDDKFKFNPKTATNLTYLGSVLLIGLERQQKEGGLNLLLEERFKELTAAGQIALTPEQATLVLKQQESSMAMKLMIKFAQEAKALPVDNAIDITPIETVAPVGKRITALRRRAAEKGEQDYAF